jgi:hypothetical protein
VTSIALFIGLFITAVSIVGAVAPSVLLTVAQYFVTPLGLYAAAALRIAFGIVLVRAASASRAPAALRTLGFVVLVAGFMTLFVGVDRARAMLEWLSAQGSAFTRLLYGLALALGVFVVHAVGFSAARSKTKR